MSTSDKLQRAVALISEFNTSVETESDRINPDEFQRKLKKLGGTSEAVLAAATWEDLQDCGLPKILARRVAEIFREKTKSPEEDGSYVSDKKAAKMHPLALLERYNPRELENAVSKRLREIGGNKRFIVFKSDGTVNAPESNKMLEFLRRQHPEVETTVINGVPTRFYRLGEVPPGTNLAEENPIFAGRPLRDGVCDQLNRSWQGVPLAVRQLIYLAVNRTGEMSRTPLVPNAHAILDLALDADAERKIRQRVSKASLLWDDLNAKDELPKLRIDLTKSVGGQANPFAIGRNTTH